MALKCSIKMRGAMAWHLGISPSDSHRIRIRSWAPSGAVEKWRGVQGSRPRARRSGSGDEHHRRISRVTRVGGHPGRYYRYYRLLTLSKYIGSCTDSLRPIAQYLCTANGCTALGGAGDIARGVLSLRSCGLATVTD